MNLIRDRRVILAGGAALALLAGLTIAVIMAMRPDTTEEPPASQGGLIVQSGRVDDIQLDPKLPLRCFVNGQFVGEMPVSDCAKRNGVATGALDVGIDTSGALAAANGATANITPLPPGAPPVAPAAPTVPADDAAQSAIDDGQTGGMAPAARAGGQACWRYAGGTWVRLPETMSLGACVSSLYAGECLRPGSAAYGRWGDRTLRLAFGRIETSSDDRSFHTLTVQGPGCTVAGTG